MKKIVAILMVLGVLGVFLGGCSGGDKAPDSAAPAKTDAAPKADKTPDAANPDK